MNRHLRRKQKKEHSKISNLNSKLLQAIDFHSKGDYKKAGDLYQKLNNSNPGNYDVVRHLGILFQDLGKIEKAYNFFQEAIKINPQGFEALNNLGAIHVINKNQNLALKCFEKSISINPNYVPTINNLAGVHHRLHNREKALKFSEKALKLQPNNILAKNQHAKALVLNDRINTGIKIFREICQKHPERSDFKANLATALKEIGEFEESKKIIDIGFRENFKRLDFFAPYASDKQNTLSDEHIKYYEKQLNDENLNKDDKILIAHTFFDYYRNKKDFKKSGEFIEMSNDLQYSLKEFDLNNEKILFNKMKEIFVDVSFKPNVSAKIIPIFICGMPRSGTTLCEQILSTHSLVSGAGELSELIKVSGLENIIQTDHKLLDKFQVNIKSNSYLISVREKYLEYLQQFVGNNETFVTDKLPHNFVLIGLIKLILPEAKIIYCKRDPIDNCFSLYTHKFVELAHQYSYNQELLAQYYLMHLDLMNFWLKNFDDIFILDNEELVNKQKLITENLLKFCGLEWEEQCLDFYKTKRQVRTASIEQVRQPINKRSIGAWKSYEPFLKTLINSLVISSA